MIKYSKQRNTIKKSKQSKQSKQSKHSRKNKQNNKSNTSKQYNQYNNNKMLIKKGNNIKSINEIKRNQNKTKSKSKSKSNSNSNINHHKGGFASCNLATIKEPAFNIPAMGGIDGLSIPESRGAIFRPNCKTDTYQAMTQ